MFDRMQIEIAPRRTQAKGWTAANGTVAHGPDKLDRRPFGGEAWCPDPDEVGHWVVIVRIPLRAPWWRRYELVVPDRRNLAG